MLFEELGFRYFGPIDGHDLPDAAQLPRRRSRRSEGPVLLHVLTDKGHGVAAGRARTRSRSTRRRSFEKVGPDRTIVSLKKRRRARPTPTPSAPRSTRRCSRDPKVAVITAAMCQGNKLEKVRDDFPDRFFDVGICEIARRRLRRRAWPRPALRPIVDIY